MVAGADGDSDARLLGPASDPSLTLTSQAQDWYTKGSHMRMPDGLEVQITGMRAKVSREEE